MVNDVRTGPSWGFRVLIWSVVGFQFAALAALVVVSALNAPYSRGDVQESLPVVVTGAIAMLVYPVVGALIFIRRPAHPIGWLFCVCEVGWAAANFAQGFGRYALGARPDLQPLAGALMWFDTWPGSFSTMLLLFLILLFPDGRLPSPRWKPAAWLFAVFGVVCVVVAAFASGPADPTQALPYPNPLGAGGALGAALAAVNSGVQVLFVVLVLIAAAALVQRFRSARGQTRQQLKWLAVAIVLVALFWVLILGIMIRYPVTPGTPLWAQVAEGVAINSQILIPIAAGIAILRHRLYEIDRIINQALVYSSLTAALALVYFFSILVLQAALSAITGQGQSSIATVLSTLAIAALFTPLRRRFQRAIDRRFYRQKYNTQRIVERFSGALRNEVDLQVMSDRLVGVVEETLQPGSVSLWISRGR